MRRLDVDDQWVVAHEGRALMFGGSVGYGPSRSRRLFLCVGVLACSALASPLLAQTAPSVTVGAGLQTSFVHTSPDAGDAVDQFLVNSARIYLSGPVANKTKFMFNTEYDGSNNKIGVLDAAAQFEFSGKLNIWAGRFLPPSDRSNLYGPYYSHHWALYTDGVQDGYPFVATGRDNGVMYWGQFDKVKVSAGAFDGGSATGDATVISAGRVQIDFWDPEDGYYLNGTYYGAKNLLAIGLAGQAQGSDKSAYNADFLLEKKVGGGGAVTVEAEWARYEKLGGYNGRYASSDGGYVLASYLFPKPAGAGKFEVLGKFAQANFSKGLARVDVDYDQKTTELNLNYVIKDFNSRLMIFFKNTDFSAVQQSFKQVGVGMQIQM
jgi:hypothetical protein